MPTQPLQTSDDLSKYEKLRDEILFLSSEYRLEEAIELLDELESIKINANLQGVIHFSIINFRKEKLSTNSGKIGFKMTEKFNFSEFIMTKSKKSKSF